MPYFKLLWSAWLDVFFVPFYSFQHYVSKYDARHALMYWVFIPFIILPFLHLYLNLLVRSPRKTQCLSHLKRRHDSKWPPTPSFCFCGTQAFNHNSVISTAFSASTWEPYATAVTMTSMGLWSEWKVTRRPYVYWWGFSNSNITLNSFFLYLGIMSLSFS